MEEYFLKRILVIGLFFLFIGLIIAPAINSTNLNLKDNNISIVFAAFDPADEGWKYRKKITINHNMIDESLTNFPVLVSTVDSDLRNKAQNDGDDILFMDNKGDANQLHHEIESYDETSGELVTWVNIPYVSSSFDTVFYMYYGNFDCTSQENPHMVWDDYFGGVWHMSEKNGSRYDSTSNCNDAYENVPIFGISGIAGNCADLDGISNYFQVWDDNSIDPTVEWTIECWINRNKIDNYDSLIEKYAWSDGHGNYALRITDNNNLRVGIIRDRSWEYVTSPIIINTANWYYCVGTYDDNENVIRAFVNGEMWQTSTSISGIGTSFEIRIGQMGGEGGNYYDGKIDEIRISKVERNFSWIDATYKMINDPSSFITIGGEEKSKTYNKYDTILIEEEDSTPPNLTIIYPEPGLYLFNQKIMNLSNSIIAVGPVDIIAEASDDESGIDYVEYELVRFPTFIMGVFQGESYVYRFSTISFGRWYVTIKAYDNAGNSAVDKIEVWKFL